MKRALLLLACLTIAIAAYAGSVYGRRNVTLSATGSGTTQIDNAYSAIALKRAWLLNSAGGQTVTVHRVDASGVFTQAVCTVNSVAGSTATFTAAYLLPSDRLITSGGTTNGTLQIEYEVQKHD